MKDVKHIRQDFHSFTSLGHVPGFGTWVCWGVKNLIFWNIQLKGMSSRPGYAEKSLGSNC